MSLKHRFALCILLASSLCSCFQPPFNNFEPYAHIHQHTAGLSYTGIGVQTIPGRGIYKGTKGQLIAELQNKYDIQYIEYGDTITLVIPTDRYYFFNTARFNQMCYAGFARVVKLLYYYPNTQIYVAGFTDNVGSRIHKNKLSQARAETMLTFLWANGINARRLTAEGYGDKFDVSDNRLIHGSAQNRRIEIQWFKNPITPRSSIPYFGPTK